jgi:PAS domain S-box-containing protein
MATQRNRSTLVRYGFTVAALALITWFEIATWPLFRVSPYLPLAAGVVLAALVAGPVPGIVATALALFATTLLPSGLAASWTGPTLASMIALVGIGVGVSLLSVERHESRGRMRRVLEAVTDGCALLGRNWRYLFVNRQAAEAAGRTSEELVGAEIASVFPHVAELPALRAIRRAMDEGIPGRIETYYAPLKTWFETNLYPTGDGVMIIARDVNERRRAEESLRESERRLRAIFDQAIAGIAQTDSEGRFLLVNERYCEIVGRSADELMGLRMQDITHPDDIHQNEALFESLMAGGENFVIEKRYVRPGGTHVWVRKQFSAVRDANGIPQYGFAIVEEITERKRAEAEKDEAFRRERSARSEAEVANRSKDEFLAVVSHELRTPLTAMLGWLRLMKMGAVEASAASRGLETVERNANSLVRLVEDLLDVSRIISGKLELEIRPMKVGPVVRTAIDVIRPAADAKQIELCARLDPDPGLVSGDPGRIQQVVWNLLANATKFTPRGGRIDVALERTEAHVAITVSDTGIGIAPELLPRVFERFRQADSSQSREHSGLGLGLAIVRHVVEMHGGTVEAESQGEGMGTTFRVLLPIRAAAPQTKLDIAPPKRDVPPRRSPASASRQTTGQPLPVLDATRVLVVEDEDDTRAVIARILSWRGAEVRACASAADARAWFQAWKPDVLVSDIGMPQESGFSLIASIRAIERERGGHVPAIALTAFAQDTYRLQALAAGYDQHIPKPVEPSELVCAVAKLSAESDAATNGHATAKRANGANGANGSAGKSGGPETNGKS